MQLYIDETSQDNCMLTYDSLPGYVGNSFISEQYRRDLDTDFRSLPLKHNPHWLLDGEGEELLAISNDQLLIPGCCKIKPIYFQECYSKSLTQNCQKIGEGLYGEVFLYRNQNGGTTVMKVIPIEGNLTVNGESQKKLKEVFSEVIIATELSNLRYNLINQSDAFIEVQKIQFVQGQYPEELLELWNLYKETKGSINESPEMFNEDQLYAVLETTYGGCDMESFVFDNAAQAFSMFMQIAFAIAVAEEQCQFEHRDLHWGNILLSHISPDQHVDFKLRGREFKIMSYGIKVSIIDFTMSRITSNNVNIYTDLGKDCGIFHGSGDYQFEIYKLMQKKNGNEWSHFEPYSNILWLSYVLEKAITSLHYGNPCSKVHKKYLNKLKELHLDILGFDNTRDFVQNMFGNKRF